MVQKLVQKKVFKKVHKWSKKKSKKSSPIVQGSSPYLTLAELGEKTQQQSKYWRHYVSFALSFIPQICLAIN